MKTKSLRFFNANKRQICIFIANLILSYFCKKNSRKPQKDLSLLRSRKDRPQKCKDFFIDRKDHACFVDNVLDRKPFFQ